MAERAGACYMKAMQIPADPKYPEMRRRRFRPIPVRMLVPNVITLLAICAGLTAIRLSTEGRMELAVAAIVFAAVLDGLDGRVARMIKGQSKFGAELDSLADCVDGVRDQRRPAAGPFQRDHGRSKQARVCGELLHRRSGTCRRDPRAASDLPRIPGHADTPGHADRALYAADCIPDGFAAAGIFGPDGAFTGAAGNGAAGVCRGDLLHRAVDRISLAYSFRLHRAVSPEPAGRMEVLPRPPAQRCRRRPGRANAGRCGPVKSGPATRIGGRRSGTGQSTGPAELSGPARNAGISFSAFADLAFVGYSQTNGRLQKGCLQTSRLQKAVLEIWRKRRDQFRIRAAACIGP